MNKKIPSREKRKVGAGNNSNSNLNNISMISGGPYGVVNNSALGDGIFGEGPTSLYDGAD